MYVDANLLLSDAQALTATAASTNLVDFNVDRDMGRGEPLALVITVDVLADGTTTDETYAFAIETDDNAAFSSATALVSRTIGYADLTAGSQHIIPFTLSNERYVRLYATLGGTTPSVTITAHIAPMNQIDSGSGKVEYAAGYSIS